MTRLPPLLASAFDYCVDSMITIEKWTQNTQQIDQRDKLLQTKRGSQRESQSLVRNSKGFPIPMSLHKLLGLLWLKEAFVVRSPVRPSFQSSNQVVVITNFVLFFSFFLVVTKVAFRAFFWLENLEKIVLHAMDSKSLTPPRDTPEHWPSKALFKKLSFLLLAPFACQKGHVRNISKSKVK